MPGLYSGEHMNAPSGRMAAVTPSDTTQFAYTTRALYVGGSGNISLLSEAGDTVTLVGVTAGSVLPIRINRVNSTNTTATNMVAFF